MSARLAGHTLNYVLDEKIALLATETSELREERSIRNDGYLELLTIGRIASQMKSSLKKCMIAAGIIAGKTLTGPMEVSVDITNRCTMGCITCWNYSPLLENPPSPEWKSIQMNLERFRDLISFMREAGVGKVP